MSEPDVLALYEDADFYDAEFAARDPLPKAELLRRLTEAVARAKAAVAAATDERLAAVVRVNNFELTGIQAVVRSVAHLRGHAQEIIHVTRDSLQRRFTSCGVADELLC